MLRRISEREVAAPGRWRKLHEGLHSIFSSPNKLQIKSRGITGEHLSSLGTMCKEYKNLIVKSEAKITSM
jgi:hypothetical protein